MHDLKENKAIVFSTYVEVILINLLKRTTPDSVLHVCGGDPNPARTKYLLV